MATPGKLSKKEARKQIVAKSSLNSPFNLQWSSLPQEDMHFILNTLKTKLTSIGLEKKEVKVFHQWRNKKNKKPSATSESSPPVSQDTEVQDPSKNVSQDTEVQDPSKNGWTDVAARRQLAIGINEVTKALERNELRLVLVCKSVKPQHMTTHLIALSKTRHVPACQVPRLSECVSEPLGLRSVLAMGFRHCTSKEDEIFTDTVEAILPRVPSLDVAWLPGVTTATEEEGTGQQKGQKRKREGESEEVAESASCTLQTLKVKRVIPNPSKKKTRKMKKT
ncbi:ribonuclease P protein subunit p38 [Diretmus argenteus]